MKRLIKPLLFVLIIASLIFVFLKPAVLILTKKQIEGVFLGASVSVGSCRVRLFNNFNIYGIKIKKDSSYDFAIKGIEIDFSLKSLIKGTARKIVLKELNININTPQNKISEFKKYLKLKGGAGILINAAEIQQLDLKITAKDLKFKGIVSSVLDLNNKSVDYLKLDVESLDIMGVQLENMVLNIPTARKSGDLSIELVKYDKFKIERIRSNLKLIGQSLNLDNFKASILGGKIEGNLKILLDKTIDYSLDLKALNLDAQAIIKELNLTEKVQMTGILGGDIGLRGSNLEFKSLKGDLSLTEPGGDLTIKDASFLENMAKNKKQSLDLLVEGFKNYRYNNGIIKLGLEYNNLVVSMLLNGTSGKRSLDIVLHDFSIVNLLKLQLKQ